MREIESVDSFKPLPTEKKCTKCKEVKPINSFARKRQIKSGYASVCKSCHNNYYKNYWQNTEAYEKHKEAVRRRHTEVRHKRIEDTGTSIEKYQELKKNGICECCGKTKKLVYDHCHSTDQFRGWICTMCNTGLGKLGDNVSGVWQALDYLLKFETK